MSQYPHSNPGLAPQSRNPSLLVIVVLGVLVVVGLVVVVMLLINKPEPPHTAATQPATEPKPVPVVLEGPAIAVDATEMLNLFRDDPAAAQAKYTGQILDVTGAVKAKLDSNFAGERALALEGGVQRFAGVRCVLPEANYFQMNDVEQGQTVTVRGRCEGLVSDVILKDCAVLQVRE